MNLDCYPAELREYISELIKRKAISSDSLSDKMLINYLYSQKLDKDYVDSMKHDR